MTRKNDVNNPSKRYQNQANSEYLAYLDNLQEFSVQLSYISSLTSVGKLSVDESYTQVKQLWKTLSLSRQQLEFGLPPIDPTDFN